MYSKEVVGMPPHLSSYGVGGMYHTYLQPASVGFFLMGFRCSIHTSASIAFERSRYALFNAEKIVEKYYRTPEW